MDRNLAYHDTAWGAAAAWAAEYRNRDTSCEYGALLYARRIGGTVRYRYGVTRRGSRGNGRRIRPNVVRPLVLALLLDWVRGYGRAVGLLHTHPVSPTGRVSQEFSAEDENLTTGRYLLRFTYVFMVPSGGDGLLLYRRGEGVSAARDGR